MVATHIWVMIATHIWVIVATHIWVMIATHIWVIQETIYGSSIERAFHGKSHHNHLQACFSQEKTTIFVGN